MSMREIHQSGPYCYTYSPFHPPIATVEPGETVCNPHPGRIREQDDAPGEAVYRRLYLPLPESPDRADTRLRCRTG